MLITIPHQQIGNLSLPVLMILATQDELQYQEENTGNMGLIFKLQMPAMMLSKPLRYRSNTE